MMNSDALNHAAPRHRWRAGLAALAVAGLLGGARAQTANMYSFASAGGGSLHDMTGSTMLVPTGNSVSTLTAIGFDFMYEGTTYTQFSANNFGSLRLGGTLIQNYQVQNLNGNNPLISPLSVDGDEAGNWAEFLVSGTAPNRVLTVHWDHHAYSWDGGTHYIFQASLYEGTDVIEFNYGTGGTMSWWSTHAAITGANPANYLNVRPGHTASSMDPTSLNAWPGNGQVYTFTPPAPCTIPAPGNTVASVTSGCPGISSNLSLQFTTPGSGVSYQWQSSPDGNAPWTNIGTNSPTHTASSVVSTTWFRCSVTCSTGPNTVESAPVEITVSAPTPSYFVYAGIQYTENFGTWQNLCSTNDVPDTYWTGIPAHGAGTWRANTTTPTESGWDNTSGSFTVFNGGTAVPAARFHSRQGGTVSGSLDFHIDLSAGTGGELLRFEYINSAGNGTLEVLISSNGGGTFTSLGSLGASNVPPGAFNTWYTKEYAIGSTSAQTVIRLKGTAGAAAAGNDIGVDNFRIIPTITCAKPTALTATGTAPGTTEIGWTCSGCTGSYYVEYGNNGFTQGAGTVAGPFASSPATLNGLSNGSYQAYVWQDCGGNGLSEVAGPVAFSVVNGDFCGNAINLASLGLPVMSDMFSTVGTTVGANLNYNSSACFASLSGRDIVLFQDVEPGATFTLGPWCGGYNVSIAYGGSCPGNTCLASNAGGNSYLNMGPNVIPYGTWGDPVLSWTNNTCSTERVYVLATHTGAGAAFQAAYYSYTPAGGSFCATVNGVSVNTVNTGTGATVNWPSTCSGNVIVEYGETGFTPGTDNTAGTGGTVVVASGTSTTLSGLTLDQAYDVYVRQDCGSGTYGTNGAATSFTLHSGDDCSRVIALGGETGSMTINTTGANNDAAFCNAGDVGGDLILTYVVQPGYGIYFTSAPQGPYTGSVAIGAGSPCPGSSLLHCATGAVDYFWVNTGAAAETVYFVQDGSDEGETTVSWTYFAECAMSDSDGDGINDCDDSCINLPGQEGDACMDNGVPGTISGCQCVAVCNGNEVVVRITVDNNALDLSWQITDASNAVIAAHALTMDDDNSTVEQTVCLGNSPENACYGFRLLDSYGDGLSGIGSWELRTTDGKTILRDDFANGGSSPASPQASAGYGTSHSFCLPLGTANIAANECGIFNNDMLSKVYCNKVTGATQYQFELSDPDAGFVRRFTTNRNWMRFDELTSNPPVPGVEYFVRVRSNVAGPLASAHFGSGCEMGLGIAETVTCSGLIPAPAYGHSCNEERAFNKNNSYIYATPVVGADEYQFRIFNLAEGYDQTFTRSTYILQLKWNSTVAPPLLNGYTYNVEVNVNVNGVYSGFCPSSCTITINNNPVLGGRVVIAEEQPELSLWPNPNDGERINLAITGLASDITTAQVRLMDLTGRLALATAMPVADGQINQVMELGGAANGTYLLQITAGDKTYTRRVVVNK